MSAPRSLLLATVAACAAIAPAAAQAAPTVLSVEQKPFSVTSFGGLTAWSSYDVAAGQYRLKVADARGTRTLPLAGSPAPFDVDAGPGPAGVTQLVYSRCAAPGEPPRFADAAPEPGADCDLYRYDVQSGRETALRSVNSAADEGEPSIFGDRVAFVRSESRRGTRLRQDVVRIGRVSSHLPTRRLFAAGTRLSAAAGDVELSRSRVAFVAGRSYSECCFLRKLFVVGTGGRGLRSVYRAVSGGANAADIVGPGFSAGGTQLFWARTNNGSGQGNRIARYSFGTGRTAYAPGSSDYASLSWVGGATGAVASTALAETACKANLNDPPSSSRCRLVATGPLAFNARS